MVGDLTLSQDKKLLEGEKQIGRWVLSGNSTLDIYFWPNGHSGQEELLCFVKVPDYNLQTKSDAQRHDRATTAALTSIKDAIRKRRAKG